jgi:hypothetical protein
MIRGGICPAFGGGGGKAAAGCWPYALPGAGGGDMIGALGKGEDMAAIPGVFLLEGWTGLENPSGKSFHCCVSPFLGGGGTALGVIPRGGAIGAAGAPYDPDWPYAEFC